MSEPSGPVPALRITRGAPTAEELAVVTALVTAVAGAADGGAGEEPKRGRWNDPAMNHRRAWRPGSGAWRASGR